MPWRILVCSLAGDELKRRQFVKAATHVMMMMMMMMMTYSVRSISPTDEQ